MRILVTGASGFVGSTLIQELRSSDGFEPVAAYRRNIKVIEGIRGYVVGDMGPDTQWGPALQGIDAVVHLAARVHVMKDDALQPLAEFRKVNVEGTVRLARQAADAGVRRFILVSSIGVNGAETFGTPFTAESPPAPHSPYAMSKYEAECALKGVAAGTGMAIVIVRPPLVYGPSAPGNFGMLIRAIHRGLPLPLGAIHNARSLIGIDNLVDFIRCCLTDLRAAHQTFLVSDNHDLSTTQLITQLGIALNKPARLIPVPAAILRTGTRLLGRSELGQRLFGSLQINAEHAMRLLDWTPPVTVSEGLRRSAAEVGTRH